MEKLMTIEEAAEYLRLHVDTVRGYLISGKLKGYKLNEWEWRIKPADIEAFMEAGQNAREQEQS